MANRFPLIANSSANQIQELASGDNLDLTSSGISNVGNINSVGVITAASFSGNITGIAATFTGNVSIGGTLTYEDVTNIDSVGLVTARTGVRITDGGLIVTAGVSTFSGITTCTTSLFGTQASFTGIVTASGYRGDGSQLTGISVGLATEALISSGIVTTLNLSKQDHKVTATGITTITCSGGVEGESHTVRITNSGIATVGFSTYFLFPSGSAPVLPTTSDAVSLISFTVHRVGTTGIGTQLLAGASLNFS